MKLIVGLGNPGEKYAASRHNLGFQTVERLAARYGIEREQKRFDACLASLRWSRGKVLVAKPLTYMNLSGQAVQKILHWYKIPPGDLMVVYDDMDLDPGQLRLRARGGAGGHKGMLSIIESLGSQDFARLRIGIGHPAGNTVDWVLGALSKEDRELVDEALEKAVEALECWLERGIEAAMNEYN